MKKILATLLFFTSFLFSQELVSDESSAFGTNNNQKQVANKVTKSFGAKNLYLSYLKYPKHVYKNQRFEIDVKALITRRNYDYIQTSFLGSKNTKPLNPKQRWTKSKTSSNTFVNKYYFKAHSNKFKMPSIQVKLFKGKTLIESRVIGPADISFSDIAKSDEKFSGVIAKELVVNQTKSKQYTNKNILTVIDMKAFKSNLEDFNLKAYEDQGITSIEDKYPNQSMIYYVVHPVHEKLIRFNYYNSDKNKFEKILVNINLDEELVSTQTDLNPNNSSFEFYKKIAAGVISLIFLALFIWKRRYSFLVFFLLFGIIFILFAMPNKTVKLKENSVIYILPTKNSTIFQKTSKVVVVQEMKRKDGFVKVMFGRGSENFIGWVKEKDVSKN